MKRLGAIVLLAFSWTLAGSTLAADESTTTATPAAPVASAGPGIAASQAPEPEAQAETPAPSAPAPGAPRSPAMQAIQQLLDREAERLAEIETGLKSAGGTAEALLALQREIEQVKQETELQILRVQADFAHREGRVEQAASIEAAIAQMTAPRQAALPANALPTAQPGAAANGNLDARRGDAPQR